MGKKACSRRLTEWPLFLDEIGDVSPKMQVKLLRSLQEREIMPVGSTETIPVDVRVISATNKNLEEMVEDGEFREDLYYRLNVFPLYIPPLRKRKEDMEAIVLYLLNKYDSFLRQTGYFRRSTSCRIATKKRLAGEYTRVGKCDFQGIDKSGRASTESKR